MNGVSDPPGDPTPTPPPPQPSPTEDGWPAFATPIICTAIVIGFILILFGWLVARFAPFSWMLETFIVCTGLSIILGAFGARAKVKVLGEAGVLVGVAAIAIIIFVTLINQMSDRYVHIKLSGDIQPKQVKTVELYGDNQYPGSLLSNRNSWSFYIFGREIRSPTVDLKIVFTGEEDLEADFGCIKSEQITPYLASGKTIHWKYSKKNNRLVNVETNQVVGIIGCETPEDFARQPATTRQMIAFRMINEAMADDEVPANDAKIQDLIADLDSDSSLVRRDARTRLGESGVPAIEPLLDSFSQPNVSYRTQLGALVALNSMARQKTDAETFKAGISDVELEELVGATAHNDETLRKYASEFLYRIGDPRAITPALNKFPSSSANGKYNLLLVIKGSLAQASPEQKQALAEKVEQLKSVETPKTNQLIEDILTEVSN